MAQAYRELMEWDYYYFKETGTLYNFIETFGTEVEIEKPMNVPTEAETTIVTTENTPTE